MEKENFDYEYRLGDVFLPCIYFLYKEGDVVYVGQTEHGLKRILCHTADKVFDTIKIKKCKSEDLDELEMKYIARYQPRYNKQLPNAFSSTRLKLTLAHSGYRIRKNVIKRWIIENIKEHFVFCGEIYVSAKDIEFTLNGIVELLDNK